MFARDCAVPRNDLLKKFVQRPLAALFCPGLVKVHHHIGVDVPVARMAETGNRQIVFLLKSRGESEKILQRVTYLSVISNTTPMLGLIGTVQGMIFAFATLGGKAAGAAQQAALAMNISHGLWATAVGLGTAVPATIFYFFFKNKATRIILGMEGLTLDLIKALRNVEIVEE